MIVTRNIFRLCKYSKLIFPYYMILAGDTNINTYNYVKIIQSYDTIANMNQDTYWGCYREDNNKMVYFLPKDSINEVLLYDFSKSDGDTIYINEYDYWGYNIIPYIIDQVDSVLIEGNYRKIFYFNPVFSFYSEFPWIEGIGSMAGILYSFYPYTIGGWWELNCLTYNGNFVYQNPESWLTDCFTITGFDNHRNNEANVLVYPNPATEGQITFEFENIEHITPLSVPPQGGKN